MRFMMWVGNIGGICDASRVAQYHVARWRALKIPALLLLIGTLLLHITSKAGAPSLSLQTKATGRYYTGGVVGKWLAAQVAQGASSSVQSPRGLTVLDPFAGDGRLLRWLVEAWTELGHRPIPWNLAAWDIDGDAIQVARQNLDGLSDLAGARVKVSFAVGDSFEQAVSTRRRFDVVITNPPWEALKPDRRDLDSLKGRHKDTYIARLRAYDQWLADNFPSSQPRRKFAGWGTNLSRVGLEASLRLAKRAGQLGIVLPASFVADDQSTVLRRKLFVENSFEELAHFPAETNQYGAADVASVAAVIRVGSRSSPSLNVSFCNPSLEVKRAFKLSTSICDLEKDNFTVSPLLTPQLASLRRKVAGRLKPWGELESRGAGGFWAGREIDETRIAKWLGSDSSSGRPFVKGRMIDRYSCEEPAHFLAKPGWRLPQSSHFVRIAWRYVSRPSQVRRLIATAIPRNWIAGNSLNVAYFAEENEVALLALLGVINSSSFEVHLRCLLSTGHISLSSVRRVPVPSYEWMIANDHLATLVKDVLAQPKDDALVDAFVAKHGYGLSQREYKHILESLTGMAIVDREKYLDAYGRV